MTNRITKVVTECAENFGEPVSLVIDEFGSLPLWSLLDAFEEFAGENYVPWGLFSKEELDADLGFLLDKEGITE